MSVPVKWIDLSCSFRLGSLVPSPHPYHVIDHVDVVGDPAQVLTLLHVHPLWISGSQHRKVRVSLQNKSYLVTLGMPEPKLIISWHHVGTGRTYRLHPPLDGQQVRHPAGEPRSKTVRIDRHETLTLRAQHRWWRHTKLTHYGRLRGRQSDVMFTRLTHWSTLSL